MYSKRVEVYKQAIVYKTVRLQLRKDLRLTITGSITGKIYYFNGGGSEVDVDERDVPVMLEKKPMRPCCSGTYGSSYFLVVEGR